MDTTPHDESLTELEHADPATAADVADRLADQLESELDGGGAATGDPA